MNFCLIYNKYSAGHGGIAPLILNFSIRLKEWSISRHCSFISEENLANSYLLTYVISYSITPWSRVLLEKLIGLQLVKKFPTFYVTRRFISPVTSAHHLSLSWARSIQSTPPHPTSWRSILLLYSHLRLGLPSGLFPSGYPHRKSVYVSPLPHKRYIPRPYHSSRFYHPKNIWWAVQIIMLLIISANTRWI